MELDKPHLHEQELKHILFLHLWLNEIDFVFIDIGANYGNTAIPAAKFFKKYGQHNPIISFEPGFVYELFKITLKLINYLISFNRKKLLSEIKIDQLLLKVC
ncbi:Methyltransferase FkbM [Crocosphaera watsonii WH 0402]|uniref:Methyltransferase FkbM n=1 Tax=Crocosphaera watsonii WH 0402 TaxID=1284629 RepID=T2JRQ7_CROWT|nr:Methyltransferase FkbM [Crocosphaera watsonii WH 0402]